MATILSFLATLFAQFIVIFYPGVFVFWFIVHNNIERLRPLGPRSYAWIAALAWLITAGPLMLFRSRMFSVRWTLPEPFDRIVPALGVLAFVSALLFIRQASRKISLRTMVGLPEVEPHKRKQPVLLSGVYSRTRNPIYFGHWLLVFSAAAVSSFAANWIGFGLDCMILPLLIRSEERELLARYGNDFAEYMRRVPRFFPQLARRQS